LYPLFVREEQIQKKKQEHLNERHNQTGQKMNTPSPLVPQGTTPAKNKSTIRIAFFSILIVHVVFIGGLLIQGCTKETTPAGDSTAPKTNADMSMPANGDVAANPTPTDPTAGVPAATTGDTAPVTANQVAPTPAPTVVNPVMPAPVAAATVPAATGATHEYVIGKGDTLGAIAKKNGVSLKALQEANPGLNATRLQIGQKVQIPAGSSAVASSSSSSSSADTASTGSSNVYVVKSGDRLERIAKSHGTTAKAIASLNGLKSLNSLKVGQKLKMPVAKSTSVDTVPAATAPAPAASSTPTTTAQVTTGQVNN
jgi:LysM repeat protein